jgi:hypothetical protein
MTDEQINAAIAEACGWTVDKRGFGWLGPDGCYTEQPDYCSDLNAMHKAEKVIRDKELLFEYGMHISNSHYYEYLLRATARERAEAFLRTLGKWEEAG